EWAIIRPSTGSLIILLQILGCLPEAAPQALVEQGGRVDAGIFQQMVQGNNLRDDRNVLPRIEGNDDLRDRDAQDVDARYIETRSIIVGMLVPSLELDHNLDALLLPDRAHAEKRSDVDDADTTDLHMM